MRLESPSSFTSTTRHLQNESRTEWSHRRHSRSDLMTRANSQFMEAIGINSAREPSPATSRVAATEAAPARGSGAPGGREDLLTSGFASVQAAAQARVMAANPSVSDAASRALTSSSSSTAEPDEPVLIHTPFGTYAADSVDKRIGFEFVGGCPMEVYFVTHAPGEWMRDAQSRIEFEKIYGAEALHIVDCHGTVPQNIDPVFVTKPAAESTNGRA